MRYIGVDVGGTKIAAGIVENGRVTRVVRRPSEATEPPARLIANIVHAIRTLKVRRATGIGVGIAGSVDHRRGVVLSSPNFSKKFKNVPLAQLLKKKFLLPARIDNDANCFTLGEARYGAGKRHQHVIGITIGTGIGGGIVLYKQLYRGRDGAAGEFGHTVVRDGGITCSCGLHGHLEAYASGLVIKTHYQALTRKALLPSKIIALAKKRNEAADQVVSVASHALSTSFANVINTLNPDVIVIGGGLSKERWLIDPAITRARTLVVYKKLATTPIVAEKLNGHAAVIGAACLFS